MAVVDLAVGPVGVGDPAQLPHRQAQPGRIQPPGHLHQQRFGLHDHRGRELVGTIGQYLGVGG
jgi:hypothetical protein